MIDLTALFANGFMSITWKDLLIGFPEITVRKTVTIFFRNVHPQFLASNSTSISDGKGNDLASSATHCSPQPALVLPETNKGPEFIEF